MADQQPQPPPEEPYQLPGTQPAWEPETLPDRPLTAKDAAALLPMDMAGGESLSASGNGPAAACGPEATRRITPDFARSLAT